MYACLSPNGPSVTTLNEPPQRIIVATIKGAWIVERAAGQDWAVKDHVMATSHIGSLAALPDGRGYAAGAHSGGFYFSGDGATWERRDQGLTIDHVFCVHARTEEDRVALYAGTQPVSLFRSYDLGMNWEELPAIAQVPGTEKWTFPPPPHEAHTKTLTFDPANPDVIYACIEQGALLRSRDRGQSWVELDSYYRSDDRWYRDIHRLLVAPSNPAEMLMSSGMGLYRTEDGGHAWEKLTGFDFRIGYPDHLVQSPLDPNTIYVSGSQEDPSSWRTSHRANGAIMVSHDRACSWTPASKSLRMAPRANIEAMCAAAWPGGFLLMVGTTDGEVYTSENGVDDWRLVASGLAPVSKVGHFRHLQSA